MTSANSSIKPDQHHLNQKSSRISDFEYYYLCHQLATTESDGVDDKDKWNLLDQYIPLTFDEIEDLKKPSCLSTMLRA
jgi:hypothetical protein